MDGKLENLMELGTTLRAELTTLIKSGNDVKGIVVNSTKHLQIETETLYHTRL